MLFQSKAQCKSSCETLDTMHYNLGPFLFKKENLRSRRLHLIVFLCRRYYRDSCSCPLMAVFQVQASSCQLGGRNISWPECEPTAAGACPLQAWLPRRSVYPRKAFSCGAAIGIAWPELSPPGNTMIYTSKCKFVTFSELKMFSFYKTLDVHCMTEQKNRKWSATCFS